MKNYHLIKIISFLTIGIELIVNSSFAQSSEKKQLSIITEQAVSARVQFGIEKLKKELQTVGYKIEIVSSSVKHLKDYIAVGHLESSLIKRTCSDAKIAIDTAFRKEGFYIQSIQQNKIIITGKDDSGILYGCLELIEEIRKNGGFPERLSLKDQPEMVLRGTCVGLQKTTYLPGRGVYEYPYTPENFPWFYDKQLWIKFLDSMVSHRMNSLYLWNGHPFASLVRLKDYPYAVEVDDATFKKNEDMFHFLTEEADRRGIWIIQMFYNIILSKPFAETNGLKTQDRTRKITPLIADYTRKSIAAFVEKYPHVGLLVTLGEAMDGDDMDVEWFTKTIIPGVKDGLSTLGKTEEPPLVLRGHDSNPQLVMNAARPLYKNLYTEAKYNGEALTSYQPRGPWAAMHRDLSALGSVHIDNVHILANLEPFRYGSPDFIQKCVQAMHAIHGANGLHLYPESSYWDWPYSADNTNPRLLQLDRDWIWYKAWSRYAWNCHRERTEEIEYWSTLLGSEFGCDRKNGASILAAYEQTGEIAPKLLRRFGISDGNRQTLTLGMFVSQLVNPYKYRVWPELYNSDGPEGEMIIDYAAREWKHEPHVGETPIQIIDEVVAHGQRAVEAIDRASACVTKEHEEFSRLKNDIYCYRALANFFAEKVTAALSILRYKYSHDDKDLDEGLIHLEKSVSYYKELSDLTVRTYLYANSMQTQQRKIPITGSDGKNKTWIELLPYYRQELEKFKTRVDSLHNAAQKIMPTASTPLVNVPIVLKSKYEMYRVEKGVVPFADSQVQIQDFVSLLSGLKGIRFSLSEQKLKGTSFTFKNTTPLKVVVGFFNSREKDFLAPPDLETDANADNYGQAEIKVKNAIVVDGFPNVNVHTYSFKPGTHTFTLGTGICLILGFVADDNKLSAASLKEKNSEEIDWLFE